jgi:hypothetical protein
MASLVKLKPFCKVFGKMAVVVASMSHVGKKPREATIFGFTSVVQIAKWLLHGFSLEAVFLLGVWQSFCRSQWRSTWKSPAKGPLNKIIGSLFLLPYRTKTLVRTDGSYLGLTILTNTSNQFESNKSSNMLLTILKHHGPYYMMLPLI